MALFRYVAGGLAVASDIALPGLIPANGSSAPSDIRIAAGTVPEALAEVIDTGATWQRSADQLLLTIPGVIRMLLIAGHTLTYAFDTGTAETQTVFLSGTGLGLLMQQRDCAVLHASAVRVGDRAVLFCGASGAGKSTLAAALSARGFALVSDDFCALALDGSPATVCPDGRMHKLWVDAIDRLQLAGERGPAVRPGLAKHYVAAASPPGRSLPLGPIYLLQETRPPHTDEIVPVAPLEAAIMLEAQAYRPALARRLQQEGLFFRAAAAALDGAGLYTFRRTLRFAALDAGLDALAAHWRALGMMSAA